MRHARARRLRKEVLGRLKRAGPAKMAPARYGLEAVNWETSV